MRIVVMFFVAPLCSMLLATGAYLWINMGAHLIGGLSCVGSIVIAGLVNLTPDNGWGVPYDDGGGL
jgi:hypothetical protein